jgi:fatty-acyl-CoA synthase
MATIVRRAVEYGYAGVDFRGYLADVDLRKSPAFTTGLAETAARVREAGLDVSCLSSSAKMFDVSADVRRASLDEMRDYAELCKAFDAPFVRIFGGRLDGATLQDALPLSAEMLRAAADIARAAGITILVETHDDWVATAPLRQAFEAAGWPDHLGILWDVHHPFRLAHEKPAESYANIGRHTRYTHWKDSRPTADGKGHDLCLFGEGDLPLQEFFTLLRGGGYGGWYTLEWEKRWKATIPEPEVAFPDFVRKMRAFETGCSPQE